MSKWIGVKDKLPENGDGVIGACIDPLNNKYYILELYYNESKFNMPYVKMPLRVDLELIKGITHWMPLPEPPK